MIIRKNKLHYISEINIIPLLDILLILLLFFIITSSFFITVLKVEIPTAKNSNIEQNNINSIIIFEILDINRYDMIVNGYRKKTMKLNDIFLFAQSQILKDSKTIFLIAGSKKLPYKEIITVLDVLYQAGVKTIGFITQPI